MDDLLSVAKEAFELFKGDITKKTDDISKCAESTFETMTTQMQETLADLGFVVPVSRVSNYETKDNYVVVIAVGENLIKDKLDVKVKKSEQMLLVSTIFESKKEGSSFKETSAFEIKVPSKCDFDKGVKASVKNGNLEILFELKKEETDTIKVDIE